MYFEINVTYDGNHFFATAERSLTSLDQALYVLKIIRKKFPSSDGYVVTITRWDKTGRPVIEGEELI